MDHKNPDKLQYNGMVFYHKDIIAENIAKDIYNEHKQNIAKIFKPSQYFIKKETDKTNEYLEYFQNGINIIIPVSSTFFDKSLPLEYKQLYGHIITRMIIEYPDLSIDKICVIANILLIKHMSNSKYNKYNSSPLLSKYNIDYGTYYDNICHNIDVDIENENSN